MGWNFSPLGIHHRDDHFHFASPRSEDSSRFRRLGADGNVIGKDVIARDRYRPDMEMCNAQIFPEVFDLFAGPRDRIIKARAIPGPLEGAASWGICAQ